MKTAKNGLHGQKLLIGIALLLTAGLTSTRGQNNVNRLPELNLNIPVERDFATNQYDAYPIKLKKGEFIQIQVEQKGIRIILSIDSGTRISDPGQSRAADMINPTENPGRVILSYVAKYDNAYNIIVSRPSQNHFAGKYAITLTTRRPATPEDDLRIYAEYKAYQVFSTDFYGDSHQIDEKISEGEEILRRWQSLKDEHFIRLLKSSINNLRNRATNEKAIADKEARKAAAEQARRERESVENDLPKLVVPTGHSSRITSMAFSPDLKMLATSSSMDESAVKLWDTVTGKELKTLWGLTRNATSVAFSPDSLTVAAGGGRGTVILWEVTSGKKLKTLDLQDWLDVESVAFSPDGKFLVGCGAALRVWDLRTGREVLNNINFQNFSEAAFSPDGKTLAVAGEGGVRFWDTSTWNEKPPLTTSDRIFTFSYSNDGNFLVLGLDAKLELWDLTTLRQIKSVDDFDRGASISFVQFLPDGRLITVESRKGLKIWDSGLTSSVHFSSETKWGYETAVASSDGQLLAITRPDDRINDYHKQVITIWDLKSNKKKGVLQGYASPIGASEAAFDGSKIASSSLSGVIFWDLFTGQGVRSVPNQTPVPILAFSKDNKTLALCSGKERSPVRLVDVETGREIRTLKVSTYLTSSMVFSPDGSVIALFFGGDIDLWNTSTGEEIKYEKWPDWTSKFPRNAFSISHKKKSLIDTFTTPSGRVVRIDVQGSEIVLRDDSTETEIAKLVALNDIDWAVVDPSGRWDASDGAQELMYYTISTPQGYEIIDFSQLKERYYEPGLLQKLLGYNQEPLRDVAQFKDVLLPPAVEPIEPKDPASTVRQVRLKNRKGGIGRVQVFVDGREYLEDARDPKLKANPNLPEYVLTFDLKKAAFAGPGDHDIKVVAWNFDPNAQEQYKGYVSSRGARIAYSTAGVKPMETTLYAIVGGVSDYKGNALDLRYAAKDAEDIYKALQVGGKNLFGADRVKVKLLATGGNKNAVLPTKENFRLAFAEFAKIAKPTDILIVYLAGHGIALRQGNNGYYYMTQEAATTDTGALRRDSVLLNSSSISSEELIRWHKSIKAKNQGLILDTCDAGAAVNNMVEKRDLSSDAKRAIENMRDRVSFHVLMGSAENAASYEASKYGQGLLTYSLLQGFKGAALEGDGRVEISKLFNYAADSVPTLAKNIGGIQRPEIKVPQGGSSFPIGIIKTEEDKRLIPLSLLKPMVLRPTVQEEVDYGDPLGIEALLQDRLRNGSFPVPGINREPDFIFVDARLMPDAVSPDGRYSIKGDEILVSIKLKKNRELLATLEFKGTRGDLPALVEKIFQAIILECRKPGIL